MSPASPDSDSDQPARRSGATSLAQNRPLHVSIVALPESMMSPVGGIHEVLGALHHFSAHDAALPREARFRAEIVPRIVDFMASHRRAERRPARPRLVRSAGD